MNFTTDYTKKEAIPTAAEMALHHIVNPILQCFISISR